MHFTTGGGWQRHSALEGNNQWTVRLAVRRRRLQAGHHISEGLPVPAAFRQSRDAHLPPEHQRARNHLPGHSEEQLGAVADHLQRWVMWGFQQKIIIDSNPFPYPIFSSALHLCLVV